MLAKAESNRALNIPLSCSRSTYLGTAVQAIAGRILMSAMADRLQPFYQVLQLPPLSDYIFHANEPIAVISSFEGCEYHWLNCCIDCYRSCRPIWHES